MVIQSNKHQKDIYRILELNEVTDVEALYKSSRKRFVLIFETGNSALKCLDTELSAGTDDERISLVFCKWRRAPTFVTLFLPEYIRCRTVELAFYNFGEAERVFFGTHKFNMNIRNGRRHIRLFPTGGDLGVLPQKITFSDSISRDALHKGKLVHCYRRGTRHTLEEGCPEAVSKEMDVNLKQQSNFP